MATAYGADPMATVPPQAADTANGGYVREMLSPDCAGTDGRHMLDPPRAPRTLRDLSLDDLRLLRRHLTDEEDRVSYWRRLFQARMDMMAQMTEVRTEELEVVLRDTLEAPRRWQALGVHPPIADSAMPEAQALWRKVVDLRDEHQRDAYIELLVTMERTLSATRRALHEQIDAVTAELIARYRTNPALALTALETRRVHA